jgi:hypothetical protein
MRGLTAFLSSRATGRNIIGTSMAAAVMWSAATFILIPAYRDITGFAPFDVQSPLSRFMIGIELGAFEESAAIGAYIMFAIVDGLRGILLACAVMLSWLWLFARRPTKLSAMLVRGGILLVPWYVVLLDITAKFAFARLLKGLSGASYGATIEFAATVHRIEFAFIDLRNYLTVAFIVLAALDFAFKRSANKTGL